ncbi:hypothetical protein DFH28DRAFT_892614, partial [Melampsora americana]
FEWNAHASVNGFLEHIVGSDYLCPLLRLEVTRTLICPVNCSHNLPSSSHINPIMQVTNSKVKDTTLPFSDSEVLLRAWTTNGLVYQTGIVC